MNSLWQDSRFGIRTMLRNRSFTLTAIFALALGIGATSAMFSVIYGVLLKPLPYRDPNRLVRVYGENRVEHFRNFPLSPADFLDYRMQNRVFSDIATFVRQDQQYGGERPERLIGLRVSHEFFHVFGAEPMLGRVFTQEEESDSGATHVVIISHNVWKRLLGGDSNVIGRTLRLSDDPFRIVGVTPPGFEDLVEGQRLPRGEAVDLWLPFNLLGNPRGVPRAFHYCQTVARLNPGVAIEEAQAQMNIIATGLEAHYPDDKNWRIQLKPLQDALVGPTRPTLLILAGAVGFVLLIACVNVANLLLARATAREREMAIRSAIGASRARLLRQMLTESVMLAALGGALGLLFAWWGVRTLVAIGPEHVARLSEIGLDARVVMVTAGISVLAGLLFGLAPALAASTSQRRTRPRGMFVIAEVALTFVLVVGAGLLLRSFQALGRVEPGFNPHGVLTMSTSLSYPKLVGARRYAAFYERFVESLARLPGVSAVGASTKLPWTGGANFAFIGIEGRPRPAGMSMRAEYESVSPDYIKATGVPLLTGRWLSTSDSFDVSKVVLVNKALALEHWPTVEACLGHRIYTMRDANTMDTPMTIVGVVGDVKDGPTDAQPPPVFYWPFLQSPGFGNYVVLRASADPAALIPAAREVARRMGNDLSIQEIRPMEQVVAGSIATQRFALQIVGVFAAVALTLALIGIYGVTSYAARQRTKEMAIRSALGAGVMDTAGLLLVEGARWILAGLVLGALAAAGLTRVLASVLYQVSVTDPWTFAAVAAILATVAAAACFAPARKVMRIDPLEALRHE